VAHLLLWNTLWSLVGVGVAVLETPLLGVEAVRVVY
jgi:hypothetical protein